MARVCSSPAGSRLIRPRAGEDVELPKLAVGDTLTLLSLGAEEKQTEPPNRYTEAGLIKELEKRGIGRPSTYASIMKDNTGSRICGEARACADADRDRHGRLRLA